MSEIESDQQVLINWLSDRDVACPMCQYNLRGLTSPKCPECGQLLQLSVSLAEPYLKAWIALLVGLLLPAGFGVMLIVAFFIALVHEGLTTFSDLKTMPLGAAYVMLHVLACVPLSVLTVAFRRRFLAWTRAVQQWCATFSWIAIIVGLVLVIKLGF